MAYYLLVERSAEGQPWAIQFGDRDKECVQAERDDYRDHGSLGKNLKVLRAASARQSACDEAVATLNRARKS